MTPFCPGKKVLQGSMVWMMRVHGAPDGWQMGGGNGEGRREAECPHIGRQSRQRRSDRECQDFYKTVTCTPLMVRQETGRKRILAQHQSESIWSRAPHAHQIFKVRSMEEEAKNLASGPHATPVTGAVCSSKDRIRSHDLDL